MKKRLIPAVLCLLLLCACARQETPFLPPPADPVELVDLQEEAVALSEAPPAVVLGLRPQTGALVKKHDRAEIDYSHSDEGYVMVKVTRDSGKRWKAQVKGPTTTYTYNLTPESWTAFPLSDGSGTYQISVFENVTGSKYAHVLSHKWTVKLKDEFLPFLYSNQYVNFEAAPKTVEQAAQLAEDCETALEKVAAIYDFTVETLSYDKELAKTVQSGYLPQLDKVLEKKTGICFDYAALMAGMLRSQDVPCKLVVGYAGTAYHAWISVWTEEQGWIDNVIWFDGSAWQRMDPTFASSGGKSAAILRYIGDGSNYTAKYFY